MKTFLLMIAMGGIYTILVVKNTRLAHQLINSQHQTEQVLTINRSMSESFLDMERSFLDMERSYCSAARTVVRYQNMLNRATLAAYGTRVTEVDRESQNCAKLVADPGARKTGTE